MLQEMKDKPDTEKTVMTKLDNFLTNERDRVLFGFDSDNEEKIITFAK